MKPVPKNVSKSLSGEKEAGRSAVMPVVEGMKKGVSMTVPGEGGVEQPPGTGRGNQQPRSAAGYANAISTRTGGRKST
jgi:hypothetical protein